MPEDRIKMIKPHISNRLILLEDFYDKNSEFYNDWGKYVIHTVGDFHSVATGNKYVSEDLKRYGKNIIQLKRFGGISSSLVREKINQEDGSWIDLVPGNVVNIVKNSDFFYLLTY